MPFNAMLADFPHPMVLVRFLDHFWHISAHLPNCAMQLEQIEVFYYSDAYSPLFPCPWAHEACGTLHQQMLLWRLVCSLPNEPEHEPPILCGVLDSLKVIQTEITKLLQQKNLKKEDKTEI